MFAYIAIFLHIAAGLPQKPYRRAIDRLAGEEAPYKPRAFENRLFVGLIVLSCIHMG